VWYEFKGRPKKSGGLTMQQPAEIIHHQSVASWRESHRRTVIAEDESFWSLVSNLQHTGMGNEETKQGLTDCQLSLMDPRDALHRTQR